MVLAVKNLPANAGDLSSIPGSGRFLGEGNGNPLQYSCLGNPMDRGAWQATVRAKSQTEVTKYTCNEKSPFLSAVSSVPKVCFSMQ